jgi:hypothetical protein
MKRTRRMVLIILASVFVIISSLVLASEESRACARLALAEYLSPTTVEMIPLPPDCVEVHEQPPTRLMQIVDAQKSSYGKPSGPNRPHESCCRETGGVRAPL